ncbi:MAG: phosphotransferase [Bacteroidota bacterium]
MKKLSVVSSILVPASLLSLIRKKYDLSDSTTCRVLRTGINHSYLISDGSAKYVLRVYSHSWRSETEILEELRFLNLLKTNAVEVSYPLSDSSGSYIQLIDAPEGRRYAVLFSFADGRKLRNLSEDHCQRVGVLMARMHNTSEGHSLKRANYSMETLAKHPYEYITEHFSESLSEIKFLKKAGGYLAERFDRTNVSQLRYGIVHFDVWYDNFSVDKDSTITLFDFDFCGNAWLVLDLSYFCMQLFHTEPDKNIFQIKMKKFFEGYGAYAFVSNEEKELLPLAGLAVWMFYLGVQSQRFDDWSNIFLTENYLKHYIGMIKSWLEYNDVDIEI